MVHSQDDIPNRLIHEKSPYLLQHAYNPVDWYPWCKEAFDTAHKHDKPIFLSIGYSTCHWCHVMERESFENREIAELMNDTFLCIKVDREERPDIDTIYMAVCQMMTGSGGWPLTIIMTPDKKPFFAATYIPPESRYGRLGIKELIRNVQTVWVNQRERALDAADQIASAIRAAGQRAQTQHHVSHAMVDSGVSQLADMYDPEFGGFGNKPKFPAPHNLMLLLRHWYRTRDNHSLDIVKKTLHMMRKGGIFDHIGFGFHRYSTDREWRLPHFEKMLYDQAMLILAYTEAWQVTQADEYRQTVDEIITYLKRDMVSPEGAFFSAEDADSDGEEGKFYLWTMDELMSALNQQEFELFINVFNIQRDGNYLDEATSRRNTRNILHMHRNIEEVAESMNLSYTDAIRSFGVARNKLCAVRNKRLRPAKDDKILTDWNGLIIGALAKAGRTFESDDYILSACRAADFLLRALRAENGLLYHRYREGACAIDGFLDDYAFLLFGLIELYETTFEIKYLQIALDIAANMIERFEDTTHGGFFLNRPDDESLLFQPKTIYDGAYPSGNSMAISCLLQLSRLTGNTDLENVALRAIKAFTDEVSGTPAAYTYLLAAVDYSLSRSNEIVIVDNKNTDNKSVMIQNLRKRFMPYTIVLFRPADDDCSALCDIVPFVSTCTMLDKRPTAYVCRDRQCTMPTNDVEQMIRKIIADV